MPGLHSCFSVPAGEVLCALSLRRAAAVKPPAAVRAHPSGLVTSGYAARDSAQRTGRARKHSGRGKPGARPHRRSRPPPRRSMSTTTSAATPSSLVSLEQIHIPRAGTAHASTTAPSGASPTDRQHGVLQPLVVRTHRAATADRWRAALPGSAGRADAGAGHAPRRRRGLAARTGRRRACTAGISTRLRASHAFQAILGSGSMNKKRSRSGSASQPPTSTTGCVCSTCPTRSRSMSPAAPSRCGSPSS